jgi:hypothetical protein
MLQCENCGSLFDQEDSDADLNGEFCSLDCESDLEDRASASEQEFQSAWIEYDQSMNG